MDDLFEWNTEKAEANLKKHGVSFKESETIFADLLSLTVPDPLHCPMQKERVFSKPEKINSLTC